MDQAVGFKEILRRLAIVDEGVVNDRAGLRLDPADTWVLDPKTAALVRLGALMAIGSPEICLEWSTGQALAAGATEDEITDVLLAIAPVAGLGRVVAAVRGVADALGYDVESALDDPDGP
ncbi:MAG: carboxymuconolactone decarboxylase family protein [Gemmatimonadota bacterium]